MQYNNGSQIKMEPSSACINYTDTDGAVSWYVHNSDLNNKDYFPVIINKLLIPLCFSIKVAQTSFNAFNRPCY